MTDVLDQATLYGLTFVEEKVELLKSGEKILCATAELYLAGLAYNYATKVVRPLPIDLCEPAAMGIRLRRSSTINVWARCRQCT